MSGCLTCFPLTVCCLPLWPAVFWQVFWRLPCPRRTLSFWRAASAFSENVLQDVFGVKLTSKQNMLAARLTVVVIAFIAIFLAADPNSNVFKIVSFAWAGFGATFGPAVLFALFWRRSNRQGVLAGLVAGGLMIFAWKFCVRPLGGIWDIYELMPAFIVNCIVLVVVSLATPAPDKSITDVFDKVRD